MEINNQFGTENSPQSKDSKGLQWDKPLIKNKYPQEIKGEVIGTVVTNPNNAKEFFFIAPKDYNPEWIYRDYLNAGFKPSKYE